MEGEGCRQRQPNHLPHLYVAHGCPHNASIPKLLDFSIITSLHHDQRNPKVKAWFQPQRDLCQWLTEKNSTSTKETGNYLVALCGEGVQFPALRAFTSRAIHQAPIDCRTPFWVAPSPYLLTHASMIFFPISYRGKIFQNWFLWHHLMTFTSRLNYTRRNWSLCSRSTYDGPGPFATHRFWFVLYMAEFSKRVGLPQ